ncbi:MAG: ParB/RepB/Spo0J family partition protein [Clostridia bacterium]|nr:ParB/RepB/Spo0J family partition protein [Clostridia bacterium]
MKLPSVDDLFSTEESRQEAKLAKIYDIPISEIDDFPDHPFKVRDDEDMENLIESIKERGVITPATVRKLPNGRYEMISGHRRKRACEKLGMETLRCEVVDMNKEEATILMVESNFQRSEILPSEKAYAYKMRYDAMKKSVGRPSNDKLVPVGLISETGATREAMAQTSLDSETQIQRYIRLTNLVPELLDFVDEGKIKMRPAVELSYLDEETQRDVVDRIDETEAFPSHDQAIRIRKAYEAGAVDYEKVVDIMAEEKPNQKPKFKFSFERLRPLIPQGYADAQAEEYVIKALEYYKRYLQKQRDQAR